MCFILFFSNFTDTSCDHDTGACRCKDKYTGHNCDGCAEGFTDFPECRPCTCHYDGTSSKQCSPTVEVLILTKIIHSMKVVRISKIKNSFKMDHFWSIKNGTFLIHLKRNIFDPFKMDHFWLAWATKIYILKYFFLSKK